MQNNDRKPEIRFSGFEAGWKKKRFGDEFDILSNNTLSRDFLNYDQGIAKNVHYGDVLVKFNEYLDASKEVLPYIEDEKVIDKFQNSFLRDGDIVIADTAEDETVGKCTEIGQISDLPIIAGLHTMPCRPKAKYAPMYLGYYLNANAYHRELLPLMQGVKVTSISRSGVKDTDIIVSEEYDEQKKIGQFLFTLDEKIKFEQDKLDQLIILKKSMLEKMFPQGNSKVPEIRFGKYTDEWEQRKFSDENELITGYPFESKKFSEEGITLVRGMNVKRGYLDLSDEICMKWNSSDGLENYLLKKNDILIQMDGALIGKSYAKIKENQLPALLVQRVTRARTKQVLADSNFMYQTIQRDFLRYICMNKTETAVPHLSLNDIRDFTIMVPSKKEQEKVGAFFENLDNLITIHQRKVDKLKNIKSSCMDKMFV